MADFARRPTDLRVILRRAYNNNIIICVALKYRECRLLRPAKDINTILSTYIYIVRVLLEGYSRDRRRLREKANRSDR